VGGIKLELLAAGLNLNYAAVLSAAFKNWFGNLPSRKVIPKRFPFLQPNRLYQDKIAQLFPKLNLFMDFDDTTALVRRFLRDDGLRTPSGRGAAMLASTACGSQTKLLGSR
jgi:hypothetical protein